MTLDKPIKIDYNFYYYNYIHSENIYGITDKQKVFSINENLNNLNNVNISDLFDNYNKSSDLINGLNSTNDLTKDITSDITNDIASDITNDITSDLTSKITNYLYVINKDIFSYLFLENIYNSISIDFFILISIICAIYTILSKNPIISVLLLIGLYVSVAIYIMLIGLKFIGLSYILIYVGAISILFIFILMLINIRVSELLSNSVNSIALIIIIGTILNSILYTMLPNKNNIYKYNDINSKHIYGSNVFNISNTNWDGCIIEYNTISSLGNTLYTDNFILLLEASFILLLAMIGAIIITIKSSSTVKL